MTKPQECLGSFCIPLSVNSQSGGQNNKIVLHLKDLFLSGDRTTIVLSSTLGITEMEKPWKADVLSVSLSSERNFNY